MIHPNVSHVRQTLLELHLLPGLWGEWNDLLNYCHKKCSHYIYNLEVPKELPVNFAWKKKQLSNSFNSWPRCHGQKSPNCEITPAMGDKAKAPACCEAKRKVIRTFKTAIFLGNSPQRRKSFRILISKLQFKVTLSSFFLRARSSSKFQSLQMFLQLPHATRCASLITSC